MPLKPLKISLDMNINIKKNYFIYGKLQIQESHWKL